MSVFAVAGVIVGKKAISLSVLVLFWRLHQERHTRKGLEASSFSCWGNDLIHVACVLSNTFILVTSMLEHKPSFGVFSQPVTERQRAYCVGWRLNIELQSIWCVETSGVIGETSTGGSPDPWYLSGVLYRFTMRLKFIELCMYKA
ncbi:hypothetical protein PO909_004829 [Leuciscus waleckii]